MVKRKQADKALKEGIVELKRLLPYLWNHTGVLVIGLIGMVISIAMDFSIGFLIRYVIDSFPEGPVEAAVFLNNALVVGLVFVLVSGITAYITGYSFRKVAANVTRDIRCDIFQNLISKDLEYLEKQSSGDMQTRVVADTGAVGRFLADQAPTILAGALTMIVGIIGALYISAKMTLIVLALLPFIFVPLLLIGTRLRVLGRSVQTAIAEIGTFAGEIFRNIKVVRAYNKEECENSKFTEYSDKAVKYILQTAKLELGMSVIVNSMAMAGFVILLWSSGKDIFSGAMTVGELVAFAYFSLMIIQSGGRFLRIGAVINVAVGTSKKILEYLSSEKHQWPSRVRDIDSQGIVQFRGVNFSYPSRPDIQVLKNINLVTPPGAHIAFVGSSGAGKSTMLELLLRLYDSYQGEILVDNVDIRSLDANRLRSFMGYVPQKESLITGSVKDNIGYGTDEATDEKIFAAARMAHADEFIQKLPHGYDTDLGEVGGRLSGGQKQRISLARALIRDPRILLLDEAKSALDAESERLVAEAIENWAKTRNATVISIAHRLSTVRNADLIGVVENGTIVDQGKHDELLERCALYRKLSFADRRSAESRVPEAVAEIEAVVESGLGKRLVS